MSNDGGKGNNWGGGGGGRRGRGLFRFRPYRGRRGWGQGQGFTSNRLGEIPTARMMMPSPVFSGRGQNYAWNQKEEKESGLGRQYSDMGSNSGFDADEEPMNAICGKSFNQPTIEDHILAQYEKNFPGYQLYFGSTPPSMPSLFEKLDAAKEYLIRHEFITDPKAAGDMEERGYYDLKYEKILDDPIFQQNWTSFPDDLVNKPQDVLNIWGLAMHTVSWKMYL